MAHHCLGSLLHYGDGVPMDKARAFQCFTFAANSGIPDSQYALGMILSKGEGCVKDINEGIYSLAGGLSFAAFCSTFCGNGSAG